MDNCKLCGANTLLEKKSCSLLSTVSSHIKEAITSTLSNERDLDYDAAARYFAEGYICRSCRRVGNKLHNLKTNLSSTQQQLRVLASSFLPTIRSAGRITPDPKRKRLESSLTSEATPVKIEVDYPSGSRVYHLTPSRKAMGIVLGRRRYDALAKYSLKHSKMQNVYIKLISKAVRMEIMALKSTSILLDTRKENLCSLTLSRLQKELEMQTPVMLALFKSCIPISSIDHHDGLPMILMCISVLTKANRKVATIFQKLISIALYAGHASKSIFEILQKVGVCLSHTRVHKIITDLGKDHDEELVQHVNHLKLLLLADQESWSHSIPKQHNAVSANSFDNSAGNDYFYCCHNGGDDGDKDAGDDDKGAGEGDDDNDDDDGSGCESDGEDDCSGGDDYYGDDGGDEDGGGDEECDADCDADETDDGTQPNDDHLEDGNNDCNDGGGCNTGDDSFQTELISYLQNNDDLSSAEEDSMSSQSQPSTAMQSLSTSESQYKDNPQTCYFKLVGDNLDKNTKPRYMRSDRQTTSLHYFHAYAVLDRVNVSAMSNQVSFVDSQTSDLNALLPSAEDDKNIKAHFCTLVSRILVKYLPHLLPYASCVNDHILHKYSKEMSMKSKVIPLGIIQHNENQLDEMSQIMECLHKYVPSESHNEQFELPSGNELTVKYDKMLHILVGGDQLTVARMRSVQETLHNSNSASERLEGLVPVVEDWHAKVIFLKVMWSRLYKYSSASNKGTMYQLRNLINRRNVRNKPDKDVNACEDFFLSFVRSHIIAAAISLFGMESHDSRPDENIFPPDHEDHDIADKTTILLAAADLVVHQFVDISYGTSHKTAHLDHKQEYAKEVMTMGLFYLEFQDAIREGDGHRVIRCWKYLFLWFRSTRHTKYAIEAMTLLTQYYYLFTPRLAEQFIWGRFVNSHGGLGRNIPADLHMEHLNRMCKLAVTHLGANKTPNSISKMGKALGTIVRLMDTTEDIFSIPLNSSSHKVYSDEKDVIVMVTELHKASVFDFVPGRCHQSFPNFAANLFYTIDSNKLKTWMKKQFLLRLETSFLNR